MAFILLIFSPFFFSALSEMPQSWQGLMTSPFTKVEIKPSPSRINVSTKAGRHEEISDGVR
jgi:hypothetical protein